MRHQFRTTYPPSGIGASPILLRPAHTPISNFTFPFGSRLRIRIAVYIQFSSDPGWGPYPVIGSSAYRNPSVEIVSARLAVFCILEEEAGPRKRQAVQHSGGPDPLQALGVSANMDKSHMGDVQGIRSNVVS